MISGVSISTNTSDVTCLRFSHTSSVFSALTADGGSAETARYLGVGVIVTIPAFTGIVVLKHDTVSNLGAVVKTKFTEVWMQLTDFLIIQDQLVSVEFTEISVSLVTVTSAFILEVDWFGVRIASEVTAVVDTTSGTIDTDFSLFGVTDLPSTQVMRTRVHVLDLA